jgi:hypothetical protein
LLPSMISLTRGYMPVSNPRSRILRPIINNPELRSTQQYVQGCRSDGSADKCHFLAANGTLEGAQQRITLPEATSQIEFVYLPICTLRQDSRSVCALLPWVLCVAAFFFFFLSSTNLSGRSGVGYRHSIHFEHDHANNRWC